MIWLIGGTTEAKKLAQYLNDCDYNFIATTYTDYGKEYFEKISKSKILFKPMAFKEMKNFIKKNKIKLIIDATHPYSLNVSQNAINSANELKIKYLRFERKPVKINNALKFSDYKSSASFLEKRKGNILLTIGTRNLEFFTNINHDRIYLRILPDKYSISKCKSLGYLPKNIIAVQGKFSENFNKVLLNEFKIKFLVTKESGVEGGILEKINACRKSGVKVIVIGKEEIFYPEVYYKTKDIIKKVKSGYFK